MQHKLAQTRRSHGDEKLRIALTADPELPVPPQFYGGIERIVDLLARGLEARGHEVTVFAHPDSKTVGRLVRWPGAQSRRPFDTARNAGTLWKAVIAGRFDIVHSFSRVAYLTPILPHPIPKLMTYQRPISARAVKLGRALSHGTLEFTATSSWMMHEVRHLAPWSLVPNGVQLGAYTFQPEVAFDAPLVFLGRIEEIKGPHLAIEIARRAGRRLIIAGNIPDDKINWFKANILPHVDGDHVSYVGPVDDARKNALLGMAAALLMPILWDEPFGIVMAEAMACGTPILGTRCGAVPEVVVDAVTGAIRDDVDGLVSAVGTLGAIDRAACRRRVEEVYSADAIVEAYLDVYRNHGARRRVAA